MDVETIVKSIYIIVVSLECIIRVVQFKREIKKKE